DRAVTPFRHTGSMVVMDMEPLDRAPKVVRGRGSAPSGRRTHPPEEAAAGIGHHGHPGRWEPLAGHDLLERVRNPGRPRPDADPELARRLRAGLEAGLVPPAPDRTGTAAVVGAGQGREGMRTGTPLVVTKDRLTRVLACEAHYVATEFGERPLSVALACGAIVDVLFRQLVTVGTIGDPMADGLAALAVDDHQRDLVSWVGRLRPDERDELRAEVERQAEGLRRRWPVLDPGWLPRTQVAMRVPLARGAVELSARADLVIGPPAGDVASVAVIEVKSGYRRIEHRADLHFYALIEALRSPAPPFVVATYYTRTGELDVDPVTEDLLMGAARRTLSGTQRLAGLSLGAEPSRTASVLCGRCTLLPECGEGQRRHGPEPEDPRPGVDR
ncbi:MAG TPA: hypothetical protein VHW93_06215, partial [Acidimicrobiales bacterium]|nr:hypothetical protein [Acidimicrobiales bacterium]